MAVVILIFVLVMSMMAVIVGWKGIPIFVYHINICVYYYGHGNKR